MEYAYYRIYVMKKTNKIFIKNINNTLLDIVSLDLNYSCGINFYIELKDKLFNDLYHTSNEIQLL
jgi:hypothetical protein